MQSPMNNPTPPSNQRQSWNHQPPPSNERNRWNNPPQSGNDSHPQQNQTQPNNERNPWAVPKEKDDRKRWGAPKVPEMLRDAAQLDIPAQTTENFTKHTPPRSHKKPKRRIIQTQANFYSGESTDCEFNHSDLTTRIGKLSEDKQ